MKKLVFALIRYFGVGVLSALSYILFSNIGFYIWANIFFSVIIGFSVAAPISYFGHMKLTYRVAAAHRHMSWRFLFLLGMNYAISQGSTYILYTYTEFPYILISIISAITPAFFAFPLGKFWVYKDRRQ